jgi:hypothetical protein
MAFKATSIVPETGYRNAKNFAVSVRNYCESRSAQFQTDTNADVVLVTFHDLRRWHDELNAVKAIGGIAQYAKDQEDDQAYDVVAEFNALIAAVEAVMDNIRSTFPTDASGYLLEKQWNAQGTYDFRQFTKAQLSTLRGLLDAVVSQVA